MVIMVLLQSPMIVGYPVVRAVVMTVKSSREGSRVHVKSRHVAQKTEKKDIKINEVHDP